jgi:hypothetical protein
MLTWFVCEFAVIGSARFERGIAIVCAGMAHVALIDRHFAAQPIAGGFRPALSLGIKRLVD